MRRQPKRVSHHTMPAAKVGWDGYTFDSNTEAKRYGQLKLLSMARPEAGGIRNLKVHPKYPMIVNGRKFRSGWFTADFSYEVWQDGAWREVIEDAKGGVETEAQSIRRQLCEALNEIEIRIVCV